MAYQPKSYRKFIATAATATMVAGAVAPLATFAAETSFKDATGIYKTPVEYLVEKGFVNGVSKDEFGVSAKVKRGDAAVILSKALNLYGTQAPDAGFTDLAAKYKDAVNPLKAAGIISGKTATEFKPDDFLTRGEVAIILAKAYKLEAKNQEALPFTDVNKNYAPFVKALVDNKVANGTTATTFGTASDITRGQMAIFLYNAISVNSETPAPVKVDTVTAIDTKSFKVNFKEALDAKADLAKELKVEVTLADGTKVTPVPTKVTVSEDRKSAVVEHANNDLAGLAGKLSVNGTELTFDYTKAAVKSVSAINAKSLKVEFNKAVDTTKAKFEVKRDTVKPSVKEIKFSDDKKSATIEFNTNMLAGDYTVSVTGLTDTALTGSVKVAAEKLSTIEFLSDVAVINGNDIKVNVQAKNQYGEIINDKLATTNSNISVSSSKGATGHTIDKDGILTVKGGAGDFKADDKVVVTIVDSATGVTSTKTVTVAKSAQVDSIQLGELKTDDEDLAKKPVNVANMNADAAKYYVPVVIKDQYGNTLKAADLAGVNVLSSNENIVKVASTQIVDLPKVGTVIKLQTPTATATYGTAVLTVVSAGTGKTASVSVKVLENAKTDVLTVSTPETTLKQGVKTDLPFSAADQYGNALVSSTELVKDGTSTATVLKFTDGSSITATGAELEYSVDYGNKNKVKISVKPTAKNVVLTAVSATGKAQTLNLTAEEAPKAATLSGLSEDLYTAIQKDETETIGVNDVIVKDQYGEDIALPTGYSLKFEAVDGTLDTVSMTEDTLDNTTTTSTVATAAIKGTEAIQISLVDNNSKVLDKVTVNLETVELKDITSFGFETVGNLYSGSTYKYGNVTTDYDKDLAIFGKKGSTTVLVDQDLLKSTTISTPLVVTGSTIVQNSNKVVTDGAAKTATLTGVIAGATDPITVTQTVTYNDAQSVIKDVIVRKTSGAKSTITDGAVVVPVASLAGKKIGPVGADSTFQFYAKDQYGVLAKELSYTVTNLKSTTATAVAIANNGAVTVTGALTAGDTFTITAIVDGVVKSIKVIVGA
ncbi:S-layer homology domain-containing protein [Priestia koreensis]|uniref:S-layer homology domain-containing protein n=1 Tax=Priestia koreensis TaxID=284581 RepID=UPI001F5ABDA9|nr:S-layer homology domain-containing protein [Priestia koreensis]UNL84838.1 S-layer homology domain-containing protein [Priestia koreensis]